MKVSSCRYRATPTRMVASRCPPQAARNKSADASAAAHRLFSIALPPHHVTGNSSFWCSGSYIFSRRTVKKGSGSRASAVSRRAVRAADSTAR